MTGLKELIYAEAKIVSDETDVPSGTGKNYKNLHGKIDQKHR